MFLFLQEPTTILSRKNNGGGCARGWCVRREFAARSSPAKFQDVKFAVPKCKYEVFMRIDMNHSFFSNYFIICLQSCLLKS